MAKKLKPISFVLHCCESIRIALISRALIFGLICALIPFSAAHAYIDPGTGSMIIQVLLATVLAGIFTIKSWWHSLRAFFKGNTRRKSNDTKPPDDSKPAS